MSGLGLGGLPDRRGVKAVLRAALGALAADALLFAAYALIPVGPRGDALSPLLRLGGMLAVFTVAAAWQVRAVSRARYPGVRGAAAAGFLVPLFLTAFATAYHLQSFIDPDAFSERLSRLDALYFTVTVFATVGFGDIVPRSDAARAAVGVQMLLNLVVLGGVLRLLFRTAQSAQEARKPPGPS